MTAAPLGPRSWIVAALVLAVAGCSVIPQPKPDQSRFYVLTAVNSGAQDTTAAGARDGLSGISLGIGPIQLPAYLDRSQIVTRVSPNRVTMSETDRWAEPLSGSFAQALAQNLQAELGIRGIFFFPWYQSDHVDRQIRIDISRFEGNASGSAELRAHWEIADPNGKVLYSTDTSFNEPMKKNEPGAEASALSRALGVLSHQIASALEATRPTPPTPPTASIPSSRQHDG